MIRCHNCILPADYPGVILNQDKICQHCQNNSKTEYGGLTQLKQDIDNILYNFPDREYDCVLGLSGGRDSTYLLHILKNKLDLNILCFFVDHGLIPVHTRENVRKITTKLDVDLVIEKHSSLAKNFPIQFNAWLKKPRTQTVSTLCMGCKSTIISSFYKYAKKYNAPLMILGWTPFEGARYKMNLMRMNPHSKSTISYVTGYLREILKNPFLIMHPTALTLQIKEFFVFFGPYKSMLNCLYRKIEFKPFEKHIHWKENEVTNTIKKIYAWQNFEGMVSSWRGDCYLAPIRQFIYKEILGYNDKTPHFSDLIRDKQLSRELALRRISTEENVSNEIVKMCCNKLEIKEEQLKEAINKAKRSYQSDISAFHTQIKQSPDRK